MKSSSDAGRIRTASGRLEQQPDQARSTEDAAAAFQPVRRLGDVQFVAGR